MSESDIERLTLEGWLRLRQFLLDLTDPEVFAYSVRDKNITRRALELLELFK